MSSSQVYSSVENRLSDMHSLCIGVNHSLSVSVLWGTLMGIPWVMLLYIAYSFVRWIDR